MINILLVGGGGFLGAVVRYLLGGWVLHHTMDSKFPWGTFVVNVLGGFAIGLLSGVAERSCLIGPHLRLLLFTGVLGGFTTFSAFGFDAFFLLRRGHWGIAAIYAGASVMICILAVWAGFRTTQFGVR